MQKCGSRTERWRWFLPQRELRCAVLTWNNVLQRVWHANWPIDCNVDVEPRMMPVTAVSRGLAQVASAASAARSFQLG